MWCRGPRAPSRFPLCDLDLLHVIILAKGLHHITQMDEFRIIYSAYDPLALLD
ncbi:MAG: hypothetical protein AVDCRST_MAG12-1706 [uncultured Rubrobacteraceae bacterium]|uniref:Uncharacterized protein n=1 Tax=uncultured Rubrobacteraceae bacterium TaxID=349277 RepID=A0A6J4RX35_9ACTN|nr:MAG: hypothetical protein AVDCRST_MAG12-1706 [uncultured Rubrobacteraceae bacterium]